MTIQKKFSHKTVLLQFFKITLVTSFTQSVRRLRQWINSFTKTRKNLPWIFW